MIAQQKASSRNISFNNYADLHNWYWSNVTPEECDNPHDDFYLYLSAHEQAQKIP
jgi:hypothetical protein